MTTTRIFEDTSTGYWCQACGSAFEVPTSKAPARSTCTCCGKTVRASAPHSWRYFWKETPATTYGPYRSRDAAAQGGDHHVRD